MRRREAKEGVVYKVGDPELWCTVLVRMTETDSLHMQNSIYSGSTLKDTPSVTDLPYLNCMLFTALATSIKPLHDVLKCINFKSQALVRISEDGLRISVEDSRSLQGECSLCRLAS